MAVTWIRLSKWCELTGDTSDAVHQRLRGISPRFRPFSLTLLHTR